MARALWSGSIAFGLVNAPVRMSSAVEEHTLHFRLLHEPDGSPIGYDRVCKAEGRPVPDSEIVKAFEVERGEFVTMSDEDFETAEAEAQGGRTIDLERMHFADEIRPVEGMAPEAGEVEAAELDLARRLIGEFSGAFEPGRFMDTYRDKLCEIIQAKQRGETVRAAPVEEAEAPSDLMDALRASLTAAHARRGGNRRPGRGLSGLSKEELYELARAADIAGRSDMSKTSSSTLSRPRSGADDVQRLSRRHPGGPRPLHRRRAHTQLMRLWLRNNSLSLVFGCLFLVALADQSLAGQRAFNDEAVQHGSATISYARYLVSSHFGEAVVENWQSEFLAVGTMAVFTIYLRQRGSPESKPVGAPHRQTGTSG